MDNTKTTYADVIKFLNVAGAWLAGDPANARTKLAYAIERVRTRAEKIVREYNTRLADIAVEHCETDDKGIILEGPQGQYRFKKEQRKACLDEQRKLADQQVEIEPYFATKLPTDKDGKSALTANEAVAFTGFVISEEDAESLFEDKDGKAQEASA